MSSNCFNLFSATFISLIILLSISSCATLNESECKSANWEIIGLEDGSQGRNTSYIGEHRKACSDYNIAPNLTAYLKGHAAGLVQFCTEQNGYAQGLKGHSNSRTCPTDLANGFNRGHREGLRIYQLLSQIHQLRDSIDSYKHRLHEISDIKIELEEELVSNKTSEYRRRELLTDIKELERESENLHHEIEEMSVGLLHLEEKYQQTLTIKPLK